MESGPSNSSTVVEKYLQHLQNERRVSSNTVDGPHYDKGAAGPFECSDHRDLCASEQRETSAGLQGGTPESLTKRVKRSLPTHEILSPPQEERP